MGGESWPNWNGATVVCIATGPSLTADQVSEVEAARDRVRVIAINDAGRPERAPVCAPWCDILYAADDPWWRVYAPRAALRVCGEKATVEAGFADLCARLLDEWPTERQLRPGEAVHDGFSGMQALSLAVGLGAGRVVLLGYDCKSAGTATNYFGQKDSAVYKHSNYESWVRAFRRVKLPPGVELVNATADTAIDSVRRVRLADALAVEKSVMAVNG